MSREVKLSGAVFYPHHDWGKVGASAIPVYSEQGFLIRGKEDDIFREPVSRRPIQEIVSANYENWVDLDIAAQASHKMLCLSYKDVVLIAGTESEDLKRFREMVNGTIRWKGHFAFVYVENRHWSFLLCQLLNKSFMKILRAAKTKDSSTGFELTQVILSRIKQIPGWGTPTKFARIYACLESFKYPEFNQGSNLLSPLAEVAGYLRAEMKLSAREQDFRIRVESAKEWLNETLRETSSQSNEP